MTELTALIVDDVPANREFLERLLAGAKFKVTAAGSGTAALQSVDHLETLPLAVVDMKLPDMSGLELVTKLRQKYPDAYVVVASMYDERSRMEQAFAAGCNVYLVKPHGFMDLFKRLMQDKPDNLRKAPPIIIDQYGPRPFKPSTRPLTPTPS
ncbi:MAG: response regulator [Anaerolineae bacterium]